jgi:hypothetical protein
MLRDSPGGPSSSRYGNNALAAPVNRDRDWETENWHDLAPREHALELLDSAELGLRSPGVAVGGNGPGPFMKMALSDPLVPCNSLTSCCFLIYKSAVIDSL